MSKNPIESAVLSNVKVDYAKGSLSLTDPFTQLPRRVGIVDMPFISRLQSLLWSENKDKAVDPKLFFYEFGKSWGLEFYKNLNERIQQLKSKSISKPQDYLKDEFIECLNNYLSYSGIGQFRITEGNKFYVIELKHSVEWALEKSDGGQMNRILAGFLSALFSSISEKKTFLYRFWGYSFSRTKSFCIKYRRCHRGNRTTSSKRQVRKRYFGCIR